MNRTNSSRPGDEPRPAFSWARWPAAATWAALAALLVAHLALFLPVPLRYSAAALYDETLFMRLAQSLA
jgi:hypothetical protein